MMLGRLLRRYERATDVVDADLSKYFDTIPHRELIKSVARPVRAPLHIQRPACSDS
jgi:retron-type reverse transcriptase